MIRVDNGPEFISFKLDHYCRQNNIILVFIQPGKPTQNAFIERCNGSIRKELLSAYVFQSLPEVRIKVKEWMTDYNEMRPHNGKIGHIDHPRSFLRDHAFPAAKDQPKLTSFFASFSS